MCQGDSILELDIKQCITDKNVKSDTKNVFFLEKRPSIRKWWSQTIKHHHYQVLETVH